MMKAYPMLSVFIFK